MTSEKYIEEEDPLDEVHRIRAALLEEHGGFEGYVKYIREKQDRLIKEGFRYASPNANRQCAAMA